MLNGYLRPEKLDGNEMYNCEECGLQEAVQTIGISESPNHLICTLLRFKYNQTRDKIMTDIKYELSLKLPCGKVGEAQKDELYWLYAIIVHSGDSMDTGHYYTYARKSKSFDQANIEVNIKGCIKF